MLIFFIALFKKQIWCEFGVYMHAKVYLDPAMVQTRNKYLSIGSDIFSWRRKSMDLLMAISTPPFFLSWLEARKMCGKSLW